MQPGRTSASRPKRAHTPSLLQMEAVECGAASLGIMLSHYGKIVPLGELRRECGVSRDGSNAASLIKAARRYGFDARGFSKDVPALLEMPPPFVVFWNFNHFLVVDGFKRDKVYLNDPAVGHRTVTMEEFEDSFTGVVMTMTPGDEFERGGRSPSVVNALRDRLSGFVRPLLFAVLAGFLLVIPGLAIPAFTQVFLDDILVQGRGDWLRPLIAAMFVAAGAHGVLKFLQIVCLRRLGLALSARMSTGFFKHVLELPVDFYSQRYSGEISNRNDLNDKVASVLSGQIASTVIDVVMMVFYAGLMMFYDISLTTIGIGFAVLNFVALRKLSRWRIEANMRVLQEYGKLAGTSIAGLQSMETIKASGLESGFFNKWSGYYANATNARQGIELPDQVLGLLPGLLSAFSTMLILVLGGLKVIEGELTIGSLVAFQMLMGSFLRPIGALVGLGTTMQELQGDLARLDDVLQHGRDPHVVRAEEGIELDAALQDRVRLRGHVELSGITFGYSPGDPPLIENLYLRVAPGQRVALVGGSGSGKSTIAKLVCGLYEPWTGKIRFDGFTRDQIPPVLMANSLGLVDQDLLLFGGTVHENLTLWDSTVPEESLVNACRDAEILERVRSMPGGFLGELAEGGTNLSGGERQRLEIARALVNSPSILVLDEATSALDTESERLIVERITLRGCTCLIVAHRLSTVRDCDEILVLDRGVVVERGTHEELWELGGVYADLVRTESNQTQAAS